jgi:hypothetical protein
MLRIAAFALFSLVASPAVAAEITVRDGTTQPENLTVTDNGDVIVGSFTAPRIDVIRQGSTTTDTFVDLGAEGGSFLGVLADEASGTLWACHLTPGPDGRRSNLRGFDLETGAQKLRWELPGTSTCNDFSVGPDRALYIADTSGKIYRLAEGAQEASLFSDDPLLRGVDGITFLDGMLYVNSISVSKFYRISLTADGKAAAPVEIAVDTPVTRPDGMRAANGKLFVAENGGGRVIFLTVNGDTAKVTVVKDGLQQPTGVEPKGDALWFNELRTGKVWSVPMPE